jgi:hypothetical protein
VPYFIDMPIGAPFQIFGDLSDFEERVPYISRRSEISDHFKTGEAVLDPAEMPRFLRFEKKRETVPHIFMSDDGIVICSQLTQDILDEFDPGLHTFIPIQLLYQNRSAVPGYYYILNVHHMLDTVVDSKTKFRDAKSFVSGNPSRTRKFLAKTRPDAGDLTVSCPMNCILA